MNTSNTINSLAASITDLHCANETRYLSIGRNITQATLVFETSERITKENNITLGDYVVGNINAIEEKSIEFMKAFQMADIESINSNASIKEALKVIISFYASSFNFNANYSTHGTRYIIHDGAQEVFYNINSTNKLNDWIERFIKESSCDIQRFSLIQSTALDIRRILENYKAIYEKDGQGDPIDYTKCIVKNGDVAIGKLLKISPQIVVQNDLACLVKLENQLKIIENKKVKLSLEGVALHAVISGEAMQTSL